MKGIDKKVSDKYSLKKGEISMPISSAISNESKADLIENKAVISKNRKTYGSFWWWGHI